MGFGRGTERGDRVPERFSDLGASSVEGVPSREALTTQKEDKAHKGHLQRKRKKKKAT